MSAVWHRMTLFIAGASFGSALLFCTLQGSVAASWGLFFLPWVMTLTDILLGLLCGATSLANCAGLGFDGGPLANVAWAVYFVTPALVYGFFALGLSLVLANIRLKHHLGKKHS